MLHPEVGMKGTLQALAPFNTVVHPHIQYECMAVESLTSVLAAGENAYDLYYKPYGLTQAQYDADLAQRVKLITLQSFQGQYLKVPSSYLSGLPDPSGVPYRMFGLSVALTALPSAVSLTTLKQDIADLVLSRLGVTCDVQEFVYGGVSVLTTAQDERVKAARTQAMTGAPSYTILARQLVQDNAALLQRIQVLEQYVIAKG
jgi:hypothetical protein